jgi:HemY protein
MKKFWAIALFLLGVGFAAVWVADNPGSVTIHWFDYRIDTSFAFLAFSFVLVAWLLAALYSFVHSLAGLPQRFSERQRVKHYQQGLAELTASVAALAASDILSAERHVAKARKHLGVTPMELLISAQIAKSRGENERARELFSQMLAHKETKQTAALLLSDTGAKGKSEEYTWGKKFRSFVRKKSSA